MSGYHVFIVSSEGRVVESPDRPEFLDVRMWELCWRDADRQRLREAFVQACMMREPQQGLHTSLRVAERHVEFLVWLTPLERGGLVLMRLYPANTGELSDRDLGLLRMLASGQTNRQIAAALELSPSGVRSAIARLREKVGATRAEQTLAAALGIVLPE